MQRLNASLMFVCDFYSIINYISSDIKSLRLDMKHATIKIQKSNFYENKHNSCARIYSKILLGIFLSLIGCKDIFAGSNSLTASLPTIFKDEFKYIIPKRDKSCRSLQWLVLKLHARAEQGDYNAEFIIKSAKKHKYNLVDRRDIVMRYFDQLDSYSFKDGGKGRKLTTAELASIRDEVAAEHAKYKVEIAAEIKAEHDARRQNKVAHFGKSAQELCAQGVGLIKQGTEQEDRLLVLEGLDLLKLSADSMFVEAYYRLGIFYATDNIQMDIAEAVRYLSMAEQQGHNKAKAKLAEIESPSYDIYKE